MDVSKPPFYRVGAFGIATLAAAVLVTGCGSSKPKTAGAAASVTPGASTASAGGAAAASTPGSADASKVTATGGGKFCQQIAASMNDSAVTAGTSSVDDAKSEMKQYQAIESAVKKSAPGSIKPDLAVVFSATDKLYAALAAANFDYTKLDPTILSGLNTPAVAAAEQHLSAYMKDTCGIDDGFSSDSPDAGSAAPAASS